MTEMTANEFVDVSDIKDIFLYTKSGYIFCYLRVYPFNLELLSDADKEALTNRIAAEFDGDRKNFVYGSYPRELDLDSYKNYLKQKRTECLEYLGRKNIIDCLLQQAVDLSSNHENFEHQHFFKIWDALGSGSRKASVEAELRERINALFHIYDSAQIQCEVMREKEIIKLCNLFGNRRSANYDIIDNIKIPEIPQIKR